MATILVHAGGNLQTAINAASLGDTIVLDAGATYTGPFTLTNKVGTGYLTITSSLAANLTAGVRVGPTDVANMAKIVTPGANQQAIYANLSAHHYQLGPGLEICPSNATVAPGDLIVLGVGDFTQSTLALCPHDFIIDRCYIHGFPTQSLKRGIRLNSATTDIANCYISDIHGVGFDTQAVCGWTGPGPFNLINTYFEGAAENVMFGGSDPYIANLIPSNILISGCTFKKQLSWRVSDPTYAGIHWEAKNLFEIKNAQFVVIDGCTFDYSWGDAQTGTCMSLKGVEQNGHASWSCCRDVTITNNIMRHCGQAIITAGQTTQNQRIVIQNNLFQDINSANWMGPGVFMQPSRVMDLTVDRNTSDSNGAISSMAGNAGDCVNFTFTNNIVPRSVGSFGIKGAGATEGTGSLVKYCTGYTFTGNVVVTSVAISGNYPPGNTFQQTVPAARFLGALTTTAIAANLISFALAVTTPGNGACSYQLQRAPVLYGNPGAWANVGAALTGQVGAAAFSDATVANGTTYYYRVLVIDTVGCTSNTNLLQVQAGGAVVTPPPGGGGGGAGTPPGGGGVVVPPVTGGDGGMGGPGGVGGSGGTAGHAIGSIGILVSGFNHVGSIVTWGYLLGRIVLGFPNLPGVIPVYVGVEDDGVFVDVEDDGTVVSASFDTDSELAGIT